MKKTAEIEKLLQVYESNILSQTEFIRLGDSTSGNNCARKYISSAKSLLDIGDLGIAALASLLTHEDVDVRVMTACILLQFKTEDSLAVLRKESHGTSLAAFGATQTLQRWENGDWNPVL